MKFVSESIIENVMNQASDDVEAHIAQLRESQPILLSYLVSEQFELLTTEEKTYFIYLAWVLHEATQQVQPRDTLIEEEEIGQAEEKNWTQIEAGNKKDFRVILDPFFETTDQEDLLAFIEDALTEEEEEGVLTTAGRELMFVGLKTSLDVLIGHES
ncbi:MAG: hypothetical protein AAGI23_17755 [Bacteroidota bacterium]